MYQQSMKWPETEFQEFIRAIDASSFLFGPEVRRHLIKMRNALLESRKAGELSESAISLAEKENHVKTQADQAGVLFDAGDECVKVFSPYLRVDRRR